MHPEDLALLALLLLIGAVALLLFSGPAGERCSSLECGETESIAGVLKA
jgi:hypothetical protein